MGPFYMETEKLYRAFRNGAGISIDTRTLQKGDIYFALKGDSYDGNEFAQEALNKGAAYVVCDNVKYISKSDQSIILADTLQQLQALAMRYRDALSIPVIAITGSNGKTTTKELIAAVLSRKYHIWATKGNLNNHIGVPLTILSIPGDAEIAIIEMGANHPGEIDTLCKIANPDYGIITNIGRAHLEGFGGYGGVIRTKGELFSHLRKNLGTVFVNAEDALLMRLSEGLSRVCYGEDTSVDGIASNVEYFTALDWTKGPGAHSRTKTNLSGLYNLPNILAAACIGLHFDVEWKDISNALSDYTPRNQRSEIRKTEQNTLLIDAYNANPSSMRASIDSFNQLQGANKWLILGDMLELGEESFNEHKEILDFVRNLKIPNILLVGPIFTALAKERFIGFPDTDGCKAWLKDHPIKNALILLKASRGIHLENLLEIL